MQELGTACKHLFNVPLNVCSLALSRATHGMKQPNPLANPENHCIVLIFFFIYFNFFPCNAGQFPVAR